MSDSWLTVTSVWGTEETNRLWLKNGTIAEPKPFDFVASAKVKWEKGGTYQSAFLNTGANYSVSEVGMGYRVRLPRYNHKS